MMSALNNYNTVAMRYASVKYNQTFSGLIFVVFCICSVLEINDFLAAFQGRFHCFPSGYIPPYTEILHQEEAKPENLFFLFQ